MGVEMGKYSYGGIALNGQGNVIVGKFCSIAPYVEAVFLANHRVDWITTYPFPAGEIPVYTNETWNNTTGVKGHNVHEIDIVIGNDVWIGAYTKILGGATIGDGAVIGSYSIVAGRIPPYTVAVGTPAREQRKRFSEDQIERLLQIRWWDWEKEKIELYIPLLCSDNIEEFLDLVSGGENDLCNNTEP